MIECSICLVQNISENEKCENNCGHFFCKPCLDGWFNTGKYSCPLCVQPIKYFKYNNENYRVIKTSNNNRTTNPNTNTNNLNTIRITFINTKRKYIFALIMLTIISGFLVQCYFIHELYETNKKLKRLYNVETNKYIDIIKKNNLIDLTNLVNINIYKPNLLTRINCSIPFFYYDKCIN
jgi:hypothetical protein